MVVRAVLSGSFHVDPLGLKNCYSELVTNGCQVLSPFSVEFEKPSEEFVRTAKEEIMSNSELENRHLAAIAHADLLWLHSPNGYIGVSAALEIGYAISQKVPIFSKSTPAEEVLQPYVKVTPSVFAALQTLELA